ncbi:MAG: adenosylmethionine--8-amino-7-oxononanoate transaminase [Endozoicomonadaceae bacterium]|nr:adenosylmethionine--8-amino-7-oxononanoate transaminase [Endozoicomonadaceae bacterium]
MEIEQTAENTLAEDLQFDRQHIWHPYSSTMANMPLFYIESASGVHLHLKDGRKLIDGMASWWCVIHGYNHPVLNQAIISQTKKMAHVMFGGLTHAPAITLAQKLIAMTPPGLQTLFFADSGSVAVEVAMKMAVQYWRAQENKQRKKFITIRSGYHGDTTGAMSVCDPVTGMHQLFNGVIAEQIFLPAPACRYGEQHHESDIQALKNILSQHKHEIAAMILEPVVQGAGGMRFYSADYLRRAWELCKEANILFIADEIATGFGRSGKLFACEHADICPDIMCLGKALTGGYMTLAATLCTKEVDQTISAKGAFMHGPTFMGNPLACSVANASLDLLQQNNWKEQVQRIEKRLKQGLHPCKAFSHVNDVRVLGAIGVVELTTPVDMRIIQPLFVEHGVWVRPFGKLVYLMPPYVIDNDQLDTLCQAVCRVISRGEKNTE